MKYLRIDFESTNPECNVWNDLPERLKVLGISINRVITVYHREGIDKNGDGIITIDETLEKPFTLIPVQGLKSSEVSMLAGWALSFQGVSCSQITATVVIPGVVDDRRKPKARQPQPAPLEA